MKTQTQEVLELLYQDGAARRFTQDSPVLPDVWMAFAQAPREPQDLLLTPYLSARDVSILPGELAVILQKMLSKPAARSGIFKRDKSARVKSAAREHPIAYHQANVAVRLYFDELIRVLLPLSSWWISKIRRPASARRKQAVPQLRYLQDPSKQRRIAAALANPKEAPDGLSPDLLWTIRVAGFIALANASTDEDIRLHLPSRNESPPKRKAMMFKAVRALARLVRGISDEPISQPLLHLVTLNRIAKASICRSNTTVKADAARNLFSIKCDGLAWAIIDSGIDARHPGFFRHPRNEDAKTPWHAQTRVKATYDFTIIRKLLSPDPAVLTTLPKRIRQQLRRDSQLQKNLRFRLKTGHDIDWQLLKDFIEVSHDKNYEPPVNEHGTHVAGILGADWLATEDENPSQEDLRGICPDINLYDFRVLDENGEGDEFTIMAAMQFIRHLNAHHDYTVLHGVNLSLSIAHDVRNYACGRTPVCEECTRLIGARVVVVAAAGNDGYGKAAPGANEAYADITITDPGNAIEVITVGSTHRDAPHTYGVSYFSSRGPTGDGRVKPDLVAPGEKITSLIPDVGIKDLDGTSMAAPHVSGVAALLMARHRELIGDPAQIKKILCSTATDLGRERYFQGCGLVDALRALQSV